ncbi:hypothetical protein N8I77_006404 [Diaporthe amygdali]|uniref:Carboxylic ester hydrolase n=1 Tax=Phomopsis amygdali TaxID=1214568 RepID=A0AAD9SJ54_PHOAM|nr:hypothetical protein N8I77_006404 [Diaporthe amygdali]KAK2607752.1 hypothetical protein N8I77_006404 [Diaporthe amygdali]
MKGSLLPYGLQMLVSSILAVAVPTAVDTTNNVTYKGLYRNRIEVFLNIPYGQDTGGENRFKPPMLHTPEPGSEVIAQSYGPSCPQPLGDELGAPLVLGNVTDTSEDCLNLNVARPQGTRTGDKLPVMVWIHGGSFWSGQNSEITVEPDGLILESVENGLPIVHVALNYRLGVFGFARSAALESEGSENAGLRDQRLAIEWVRDNIEYFGGDPKKITVSGQSTGGLSVGMQIMAYGGSKPVSFQQAICESQALEPGITGNFTVDAMQLLVDYLGCNTTSLDSEQTVACLRGFDKDALMDASLATYIGDTAHNIGDIWLPVVDGDFLPAAPSELIRQGRFANVTTMIGWADNDVSYLTEPSIQTANDTRAFFQAYAPAMTDANVDKLLALYPASDFQANADADLSAEFYRAARVFRDIMMTCPPLWYGEHMAASGSDVYHYAWNQSLLDPILGFVGYPGLGVVHTSELAYVFGNLSHYDVHGYPFAPDESDYSLLRRGSRSWSSFVSSGRPSLEGLETFEGFKPAFEEPGQTYIFVAGGPDEGLSAVDGSRASPALASQRLRERCEFINSPEMIEQLRF